MVNLSDPSHGQTPLTVIAGPTCRIRHAFGRNCDLPLLHRMDIVDGKPNAFNSYLS